MISVRFSASGFGTKIIEYEDEEELFGDIYCTCEEHQGTVEDYKNGEHVVIDKNGEEVGRWEIIKK